MKSLKILIMGMGISLTQIQADTWNMATPYGENYFQTKNIHLFIDEIKEKTNGEITINLHSGASLYKAPEIFKAVRSKQIELGELLLANVGNDNPLFKVDNIPFLATSYEDAQKLWSVSKPKLTEELEKMGAVLLYVTAWPPQNFYTESPIDSVDYFNNKKMRTYNATTSQMASLLGAAPTTIQAAEVPQAFSTGTVDAMITSGSTGVSSQAWDFVKNYTEVQAWLPKNMVFINKKTWDRLDDNQKNIILEAAKKAEERGWSMSQEVNEADRKTLADNGMTIHKMDDALSAALKKVGEEMTKEWLSETGEDGQTILTDYQK